MAAIVLVAFLTGCGSGGTGFGGLPDASVQDARTSHDGMARSDVGKLRGSDSSNDVPPACTGLECQVKACSSGSDTTVTGTVYAPNGRLPLYNVQVFIPNAPLQPFTKGIQCDQCGAALSGDPITATLSDSTGSSQLTGVPVGTNIPIVVQLGKWRRAAVIPTVAACSNHDPHRPQTSRACRRTRPKAACRTSPSRPGAATASGACCPRSGIDPAEFGIQADGYNKAINMYIGAGPTFPAGHGTTPARTSGAPRRTSPRTTWRSSPASAARRRHEGDVRQPCVRDRERLPRPGRPHLHDRLPVHLVPLQPRPDARCVQDCDDLVPVRLAWRVQSQCASDFCVGTAPSAACTTCIRRVGRGISRDVRRHGCEHGHRRHHRRRDRSVGARSRSPRHSRRGSPSRSG